MWVNIIIGLIYDVIITICTILLHLGCDLFTGYESDTVIVFIHGLNGHPYHFWLSATHLKQLMNNGKKARIVYFQYKTTKGVASGAYHLDKFIRTLTYSRIILVGHSFGGIVAARYCQIYNDKVSHIITLAAPWKGCYLLSYLPMYCCNKSCRDITPGNVLLTNLCIWANSTNIPIICIGSPCDVKVPLSYASYNNKAISMHTGHTQLITTKFVQRIIYSCI